MTVYVVKMNRWGDSESHSYLIGAYSTEELATVAGVAEEDYRGGKYDYEIHPLELDVSRSIEHIKISKESAND